MSESPSSERMPAPHRGHVATLGWLMTGLTLAGAFAGVWWAQTAWAWELGLAATCAVIALCRDHADQARPAPRSPRPAWASSSLLDAPATRPSLHG